MFLGASSTYVECLTIAKLTHIGGQKKTAPKKGRYRYPNLVIQKTEAVKSAATRGIWMARTHNDFPTGKRHQLP